MTTTLYWFSGTGNSLFAARMLAEALGDTTLVPMAGGGAGTADSGGVALAAGDDTLRIVGGEGQRVGFVFPSYYGDLPRLVRAFIERLDFVAGSEVFVVVTMGAFGQGSITAAEQLLASKGVALRYGVGVRMPPNYILKYDPGTFGAGSARRISRKLGKVSRRLRSIAIDIVAGKQRVRRGRITAKTLYTDSAALDEDFRVTDVCTSCGQCVRICPVGNIRMSGSDGNGDGGQPIWLHHCEHCVACISWCPCGAIEYGKVTPGRVRYRNPEVRVADLQVMNAGDDGTFARRQ
ncbi:MAG: EFR1 family ferrodoxin [Actinomycetes bacterium]|nr:EFR1 family ferrodoxin [Actinomycetes bacterium]